MFPLAKLRELSPARACARSRASCRDSRSSWRAGARPPDPRIPGGPPAACWKGSRPTCFRAAHSVRGLNTLRHELLRALHTEPAEWDLVSPATGFLDRSGVSVVPITVYLEDVRSPFNVGSIFRTAEAFGAERILLSPRTPLPTHPRAEKTAMGAARALPWETAELATLRGRTDVFALELGGTPLESFVFPSRGTVLVGSEELGLSSEALDIAAAGLGRVSIPLAGAKRSLNVSVAVGILMQAWLRYRGLHPLPGPLRT